MKRILILCLAIVLAFSVLSCVCFAEETTASESNVIETAEQESESIENEGEPTAGEPSANEIFLKLFDRLYEFFMVHKTEILGLIGDAIIFVLALILKSRVSYIKKTATHTDESQGSVVDVVNNMIDGYNALQQTYDKYGATEDDRNRVIGTVVAMETAILEILTTVYVNSKNLPQGVKDLVNLKYANCLKQLDNDEQLKAIVTAVRENIGTSMTIPDKVSNESTEV